MISVCIRVPNPVDATSWYRAFGPLSYLRQKEPDHLIHWSFKTITEESFASALMYDIAFFQRPMETLERQCAEMFKKMGVPVVIDYDDDLTCAPTDNPFYSEIMKPERQANIRDTVRLADAIMVTTRTLAEHMLSINPDARVYIVPNSLDDRFFSKSPQGHPTADLVFWRGSATHSADLMENQEALQWAATEKSCLYYGFHPWFLKPGSIEHQPFGSLPDYFENLKSTAPKYGIVPLKDSPFNRAKSNIALLEMTWAGAAVICPDWDDWALPGAITYGPSSKRGFKEALQVALAMTESQRERAVSDAWTHIQSQFMLSKTNDLRRRVFLAAAKQAPWPDPYVSILKN